MTVIINGSGTANGISYFSSPTTFGGTLATASRGISNTSVPSGSVLQVVQSSTNSTISTTSSSFTATGFTASITPFFSTSKILVSLSGGQYRMTGNGSNSELWGQIWKSVAGGAYSAVGGYSGSDLQEILINYTSSAIAFSHSLSYLDSPATTSAITYQPYFKSSNGTTTVYFNMASPIVYMTLMEIAQ